MDNNQLKILFNSKLTDIAILAAHLIALGLLDEKSIDLVPAYLEVNQPGNATPEKITFGEDGRSQLRSDGAIRYSYYEKGLDSFLTEVNASPAQRERYKRWIFAQESMDHATSESQRFNIDSNVSNARFDGFGIKGQNGWKAFEMRRDPDGRELWLQGAEIKDAFAIPGNAVTPTGKVLYIAPSLRESTEKLLADIKRQYPDVPPGLDARDPQGIVYSGQ